MGPQWSLASTARKSIRLEDWIKQNRKGTSMPQWSLASTARKRERYMHLPISAEKPQWSLASTARKRLRNEAVLDRADGPQWSLASTARKSDLDEVGLAATPGAAMEPGLNGQEECYLQLVKPVGRMEPQWSLASTARKRLHGGHRSAAFTWPQWSLASTARKRARPKRSS